MTDIDNHQMSGGLTWETTSMLPRADVLNEPAPLPTVGLSGLEGLAPGSALLVVKRGPNAGARFLLNRPVTSAGRHPGSDIFLDEVTVSRKHAEFRWEDDELHVVDLGSLNGTYVTGRQSTPRCWSTATRCSSASFACCSSSAEQTRAAADRFHQRICRGLRGTACCARPFPISSPR